MAEAVVLWEKGAQRLVRAGDNTFVIEQVAPDVDALGNKHWIPLQWNHDLIQMILQAIYG